MYDRHIYIYSVYIYTYIYLYIHIYIIDFLPLSHGPCGGGDVAMGRGGWE